MPSGRAGTALFFAATFAITWGMQLPAWLALHGVIDGPAARFMAVAGLGTFGPMLAALIALRSAGAKGGARALFGALLRWRVSPLYYAVALLLPGALLSAGLLCYRLASGDPTGAWFYPPDSPQRVVALLLIPFVEELGWRGFALPRLLPRYGALHASLILGVIWALWHIPMFQLAGVSLALLPVMLVFFSAGSVLFTWLYVRSSGSLLIVVLAHAGAHLDNSHIALPGDTTPLLVHTAAYCLVALLLVLGDRSVFQRPATATGATARA